jgi:hypothetical protein
MCWGRSDLFCSGIRTTRRSKTADSHVMCDVGIHKGPRFIGSRKQCGTHILTIEREGWKKGEVPTVASPAEHYIPGIFSHALNGACNTCHPPERTNSSHSKKLQCPPQLSDKAITAHQARSVVQQGMGDTSHSPHHKWAAKVPLVRKQHREASLQFLNCSPNMSVVGSHTSTDWKYLPDYIPSKRGGIATATNSMYV